MILRAVLVDDEPQCIRILCDYLQAEVNVVATAVTPREGIRKIQTEQPDIVFIDVCMPGFTGFEVIEHCSQCEFETIIVSAHERFAFQAYKHHAFHYLLKPYTKEEVLDTVHRITELRDNLKPLKIENTHLVPRISVSTIKGTHILQVKEIIRCEGDGSYTKVHLKGGNKVIASQSIRFFDKQLACHGFLRVHKSHLINLEEIEFVDHTGGIHLRHDPTKIQVAMRRRKTLMNLLTRG